MLPAIPEPLTEIQNVFAIVQTVPNSRHIESVISQHASLRDAGSSLNTSAIRHGRYIVQQDDHGDYPETVGPIERGLTSIGCDAANGYQ